MDRVEGLGGLLLMGEQICHHSKSYDEWPKHIQSENPKHKPQDDSRIMFQQDKYMHLGIVLSANLLDYISQKKLRVIKT